MRFWRMTVEKSLLWCLETTRKDKFLDSRLKTTQMYMVRRMMKEKRIQHGNGDFEPWLDWQKRSMRSAWKTVREQNCDIRSTLWDARKAWAGHVSRFGTGTRPQHI